MSAVDAGADAMPAVATAHMPPPNTNGGSDGGGGGAALRSVSTKLPATTGASGGGLE